MFDVAHCISLDSAEKHNQQDIYGEKDFYKELGHVIIKANKSQDLQGEVTNWRTDVVVPVLRPEDLRPGKNRCFHLSLKAGKC